MTPLHGALVVCWDSAALTTVGPRRKCGAEQELAARSVPHVLNRGAGRSRIAPLTPLPGAVVIIRIGVARTALA